jgi:hypothetical protein
MITLNGPIHGTLTKRDHEPVARLSKSVAGFLHDRASGEHAIDFDVTNPGSEQAAVKR